MASPQQQPSATPIPAAPQHLSSNSASKTSVASDRGQWDKPVEFFLSCLGYAVGLGNVWRFPYLCYKNGGGAFLIPYVIMLTLCGLPIFFMELAIGQYHGSGPNKIFKHLALASRGVGYAMLVVSFLVTIYYNVIMAWAICYTFASFTSQLGWASCGNTWNTPQCYSKHDAIPCMELNLTFWNNTCIEPERLCNDSAVEDITCVGSIPQKIPHTSAAEEYFLFHTLDITKSMDDVGHLRWQLVLCLLLAWTLVALCLIKGVKSSGKVVYFTALFPYVVLVILLIRGATLDGASDGIYFYIVPKWEMLGYAQTWADAASQIFYSLGPGFGGLLTLASYNKFNNNCYRDAIVIAISNCATSVFAGFVIFSILGFMAHSLNVPVDTVVKSGFGLAFIAYPEAVANMPLSQLWSILFFFMLITLGLDSQFAMCETLVTGALDQWPKLRTYKSYVVICICVILFLLALPLCTQGGIYFFILIDTYSAGWSLLFICFCEAVLISWIYGYSKFQENIEEMVGYKPSLYWKFCWKFGTPMTLMAILIFTWVHYKPTTFGQYAFPLWANILGWLMAFTSVILIPSFAIYELCKKKKKHENWKSAFQPTSKWGPSSPTSITEVHTIDNMKSLTPEKKNSDYNNPAFASDD